MSGRSGPGMRTLGQDWFLFGARHKWRQQRRRGLPYSWPKEVRLYGFDTKGASIQYVAELFWDFWPPSSPCMQILATSLTRYEHYVCILAYLTRFQCVNTKWKPLTISKPEGLFFCGHGRGRQSQRTESTLNPVPVSGQTRLWKGWFKSLSPSPRVFCGDRPTARHTCPRVFAPQHGMLSWQQNLLWRQK